MALKARTVTLLHINQRILALVDERVDKREHVLGCIGGQLLEIRDQVDEA